MSTVFISVFLKSVLGRVSVVADIMLFQKN